MISLLLPTPGDPLILDTWYKNYLKYEHLIDECIICINAINLTDTDLEKLKTNDIILNFWKNFESNKVKIFYNHGVCDHGHILTFLFEKSKGDIIFLMEDDDYIININLLEDNINKVKNGTCDIVGVPRNCCSTEIINRVNELYDRKNVTWWPSNFICKRSLLEKTNLNFSSKNYKKGEYIPELKFVFENDLVSDTMTYLSLQLLVQTDKIHDIDYTYHSNIHDSNCDFLKRSDIINLHVGSLSSLFNLKLFNDFDFDKFQESINFHGDDENIILEILRRLVYLDKMLDRIDYPAFYLQNYKKNLNTIFKKYQEYFEKLNSKIITEIVSKI